jgi:hypothetical protein
MFLLFGGSLYYPLGGWSDYQGAFTTMEEAEEAALNGQYEWWHVVKFGRGIIKFGGKG